MGARCSRATTYELVGGYRSSFYFAQDLDLWVRLAERGRHLAIQETLYEASLTLGSISTRYRKHQVDRPLVFILESARVRRDGKDDAEVLASASRYQTRHE